VETRTESARRAVWIVVAGTVIGGALIALARHIAPSPSAAQAPPVVAAVGVLAVVPLLVLAAYLWRLGTRARLTGQFPPPGTATIRTAPPVVGLAARRRAGLAQAFSVLLGACAIALAVLLGRLFQLVSAR
jgi:hypothetical protein